MLIKRLLDYVGIASAVSVALLPVVFVASPVVQLPKASASGFETEARVVAAVDQALAFTATPEIVMGATQSYGKTVFSTGSGSASLRTNAVGYVIQISAQDTRLVNQTTTTAAKKNTTIPTIESTQTGTAMVADSSLPDSWGYTTDRVSGTQDNATDLTKTYSPIPASSSPVTLRDTDFYEDGYDGIDSVNVGYGVKVSPDLRSGLYTGTINFTVVGYVPLADIDIHDIKYMQQMTANICAATTTPLVSATEVTFEKTDDRTKIPRTTMIDKRDGRKYLVSKFADGHCWMSQNLELDLDNSVALTSGLTDLNTKDSWTPRDDTIYPVTKYYEDDAPSHYYSAESGSYGVTGDFEYANQNGKYSGSPTTNDGKSEWERVGNLYEFNVATAGSQISDGCGNNAEYWFGDVHKWKTDPDCVTRDSICPRGWMLPDIGEFSFQVYDNYYNNEDYDEDGTPDYFGSNSFVETYRDEFTNDNIFSERFALTHVRPYQCAFGEYDTCLDYREYYGYSDDSYYTYDMASTLWSNLSMPSPHYNGIILLFQKNGALTYHISFIGDRLVAYWPGWNSSYQSDHVHSIRCVARD